MKKRVLSMFMALALCLTLLPAPAWAEEADAPEGGAPAADEQPVDEEPVQEKEPPAQEDELPAKEEKSQDEPPAGADAPAQDEAPTVEPEPPAADEQPGVQSEPAPQAAVQAAEVPAENAVAQVGNVNYANITDAFAAVKENGGTLTLLANCELPYTAGNRPSGYDASGSYTLDLNGHTLNAWLDLKTKESNLTIQDSKGGGKLQAPGNWNALSVNAGSATIKSGTLASSSTGSLITFGDWEDCGTLNIEGGSFETGRVYIGYDGGKTVISGGAFHELQVCKVGDKKSNVSISGGTFDTVTLRYGITQEDILASGYTFVYQSDGSAASTLTNVKVVSQETANALASLTVDGTKTHYGTFEAALAAAQEQGGTLTLLNNVTTTQSDINSGTFTLDLNGHTLTGKYYNTLVVRGGSLTIQDSSKGGGVISSTISDGRAVLCSGGNVTILGGSFPSALYWESGTVSLRGGEFRSLNSEVGSWLSAIPEGKALEKEDDHRVVDASAKTISTPTGSYVLADHEKHDWQAGKCACGREHTDHTWKDGVCTVCGFACPHNAGAAETGGVWACNTCGQTVTAKVTAPGGAITYYADGYVNNNVKSGLYFAIKAAETGSTVAALGGEYLGGYVTGGKTLTLDVSNGKTIDGILYVGEGENDTGNKLIVRGSTEISYVIIAPGDNTLDLTGWTGRIGFLTVQNGGKATLNGGTFATLNFNGAAAGSLLASGYAFQNVGTGEYVEYSSTANMENVKVVKCPHSGVTLKENHTGVACKYCGASFAATLDDAPYDTIDAAVTEWLENGGTLKLYADYTATTEKATWTIVSGEYSIDLNGHMMSVEGDGSAFKPTNNMHLTVTDGTARGQITNILLDGSQRGSFTLESGYVGNLKMTGGAVVALKGGSVDNLDVQNCSADTNLSIQGGSIGQLNIKDWAEGMHVSATGGSLGAYTLPSGKILADVLDHRYYAEGTSLDRQVHAATQPGEKFVIKQAPHDFGSTSQEANVPINGSIPFRVDSPSGDATGYYDVRWYRRTNGGAEHMVENRVAGVKVGDKLDVFCVITGLDSPGGAMQWQVAVKDYTINVVPAKLNGDQTVIRQKPNTGNTGNSADNRLVVTPFSSNAFSDVEYKFEVTYNRQSLELGKDYTIKDSSNLAKNAGTHTLTIEGKGNYTGQKSVTWTLEPYELSVENFRHAHINKTYDGTDAVTDSTNGINGLGGFIPDSENPRNPPTGDNLNLHTSDYQLSNMKFDSAEAGDRTFTGTMTLKPDGNFIFADGSRVMQIEYGSSGLVSVSINRATIAAPAAKALQVANNHAATYTVDLSALLPALEAPRKYGAVTYGAPTVNLSSDYYTSGAKVEDGKLILPIQAVKTDKTGSIGSVQVKVSTTNYHDFILTINVNATNKIVPTGEPTLSTETLTYGQALSAIKLSGTMKDGDKAVPGMFAWVDGTVKPSAGSYKAAWKFTPTDGDTYAETTGTVSITVYKAKPTGDPIYTRITAANKTLKDAALKPNTSWPNGTIQWVDKDGKELPDTTEVKANTAYKWIFTPGAEFAADYTTATGELTLYSVSTGGGGGGGSSSGSTVKTDTVTNPDGSVTKTETKKDGTVIETTTGKDGSVSQTTTNPNGSSVTETKAANGSTGTVKTDKHGQTTAETTLSSKAVKDAKENGEAVKAPVEVEATRNSDTAPTVKVELPKGAGETKVEIPVSNATPGTVAVLVHPDGTEEIVKNSLPTEDGIQLTVNGGATVKIVDNSKDFIDTWNYWAKDAIDFVSARGLVNGMSATIYAPNNSTTRSQLWTILARQADADLTGGSTWYEKAQNWVKTKGISDGTNPNGTLNRAQIVTMLWRAAGQPVAGGAASFTDVSADSYYAEAVAWAIENGITAGVGNGKFDPNATCTRAQIATFLHRSYLSK